MFKLPKSPPSDMLRIEPFKGINLSVTTSQIDQSESPEMLNFTIDERGALNKRTGYKRAFATSLGVGKVNGLYEYIKTEGTVYKLLAHGTQLYTWEKDIQPTSIYNGLSNADVHFFTFKNICYIMDGTNFLQYDGTTVKTVEPYIPTITISREPTGGGASFEDINLLGAGFKDSFSADGVATEYVLSFDNLDVTTVTAEVNGVPAVEGTDFAVNRTTGRVTFITAATKGTNNVVITAYKTFEGFSNRVKKNRFSVIYGGSNDTRVFIGGNPDMSDYVWRCGVGDPSYWPENGFYKYSHKVRGFSKQYDYLVIDLAIGKQQVSFQLNDGIASFPSKPINDKVGTLAEKSIQLIENNPVSLSKDGIYMLVASSLRDERNVQHISDKVDAKLLKEPNLDKAVSIDYDRKYWLAVNGNVYVFDYDINEWYIFNNIHASHFLEIGGYLYFGSSTEGLLYYFKKEADEFPYDDDGQVINAYWVSKLLAFQQPEFLKLVQRVFIGIKPNIHTSLSLYTRTNTKGETFTLSTRMDKINFFYFDFTRFSFITSDIPQEVAKKVKLKKITHLQLKIENNVIDEGLGILNLAIKHAIQNEVK